MGLGKQVHVRGCEDDASIVRERQNAKSFALPFGMQSGSESALYILGGVGVAGSKPLRMEPAGGVGRTQRGDIFGWEGSKRIRARGK